MRHICLVDPRVHPSAVSFYRRYQVEPIGEANTIMQVPPEGIYELPGMNLDTILDTILSVMRADRRGSVMMIHHGNVEGIAIPVAHGTVITASAEALNVLRSEEISTADAASVLHLSSENILDMRRKIQRLRRLDLDSVVMRSCNIGQWAHIVEAVRRFFGARCAEAPKVRDAFSSGAIVQIGHPGTGSWRAFSQHPRAQIFRTASGQLIFRSISTGSTRFRPEIMAESGAAIEAWIAEQIPAGAWVRFAPQWAGEYDILLHGMWASTGLIFPAADAYRRNLLRARGERGQRLEPDLVAALAE